MRKEYKSEVKKAVNCFVLCIEFIWIRELWEKLKIVMIICTLYVCMRWFHFIGSIIILIPAYHYRKCVPWRNDLFYPFKFIRIYAYEWLENYIVWIYKIEVQKCPILFSWSNHHIRNLKHFGSIWHTGSLLKIYHIFRNWKKLSDTWRDVKKQQKIN